MNLIIYIQYVANTLKFVKRQPTPLQGIQYYPIKCFVDNRYKSRESQYSPYKL